VLLGVIAYAKNAKTEGLLMEKPDSLPYLMSEWEIDLGRLLARWPATAEFQEASAEIDRILLQRAPDSAHAESLANRLIAAMAFVKHRQDDGTIDAFVVFGSSGAVAKPAFLRALFRVVMDSTYSQLRAGISAQQVAGLMADDKIGEAPYGANG
jgi:hypothetical protein